MELKIVNPDSVNFIKQLGISDERVNELAIAMDKIVRKNQGHLVRTCDMFNEIAALCNTLEEYTYCIVAHTNFMHIKYRVVYCPPVPRNQFPGNTYNQN